MLVCINKNSSEYQKLLQASGISDSLLEPRVRGFVSRYDRYPNLDEIDGANSEDYVRQFFNIKDNSVNVSELLDKTSTHSIQDAVISINNLYRDIEFTALELGESAIININRRPNTEIKEIDRTTTELANSAVALNDIVDRLSNLYGIDIIPITNEEIQQDSDLSKVIDAESSKGFIYNNQIYINLDNATLDTPVHELLHIMFGGMRYQNPELYFNIVAQAEQLPSYSQIIKQYPNRTRGDLAEEVFITELAKEFTFGNSDIHNLPENIRYEIGYNIDRILDSSLKGDYSVRCVNARYSLNLNNLGKLVNSKVVQQNGSSSLKDSQVHRIMANVKQDLLKNHQLEENCE